MTKKEQSDEVVLSYFDCLIRESDIAILKSNGWLNDAIIGFYFVFLEKGPFCLNSDLLFVGPEVTQCLKESPSCDIPVFLDPLEAKKKNYIFMAVNDSGKTAGGTHWSLLVFSRQDNKFYHIDSSIQANHQSALKLAQNLGLYLSQSSEVQFSELISLQQDNSYDCGIYLLCNLENIAEQLTTNSGDIEQIPFIKRETVANMRKELLQLIFDCKQEKD